MLDKNQIQTIFLFKFKMGRKAAKTTCSTNNAFGPGTRKECTLQWWFKKFCKRDESPEDDEQSNQPLEVDKDQLRGSSKLILLKLQEKLLGWWTHWGTGRVVPGSSACTCPYASLPSDCQHYILYCKLVNVSCWKKYQQPQICRWYHPNGRKWRGTKKPLDEDEGGK